MRLERVKVVLLERGVLLLNNETFESLSFFRDRLNFVVSRGLVY